MPSAPYIQMTATSNTTTWTAWNNVWLNQTGTTTVYANVAANWVWTNVGTTTNTITMLDTTAPYNNLWWTGANEQYELTREQKRAARVSALRTGARNEGYRLQTTWDHHRLVVDLAALTVDEVREIEDAFQRGAEERIEANRRQAEDEQRRLAAQRKAEKLLVSLLSHDQKEEWLANRRVTEVAPSGRVWRMFPQWSGAATLMDGDVRRSTLCVHPRERVPEADNMAALIMALRSGDEDHLIQISILHGGTWTPEEQEIRRNRVVQRERFENGYVEVPA